MADASGIKDGLKPEIYAMAYPVEHPMTNDVVVIICLLIMWFFFHGLFLGLLLISNFIEIFPRARDLLWKKLYISCFVLNIFSFAGR